MSPNQSIIKQSYELQQTVDFEIGDYVTWRRGVIKGRLRAFLPAGEIPQQCFPALSLVSTNLKNTSVDIVHVDNRGLIQAESGKWYAVALRLIQKIETVDAA